MCSLPNVFLQLQARLSFIQPDQFFIKKEIHETEPIQCLWKCLITIILSFWRMFTLLSIPFCINPCAVPIKADWRRVKCDLKRVVTKMICQKTKNTSTTEDRKDNKLPQEYMWAPLFPDYLLDIQRHPRPRNFTKIMYNATPHLSAKQIVFLSILFL